MRDQSRRDVLRRLAYLGLAAPVAVPLLAACERDAPTHRENVRDHGAVGDGETDDTDAFQAAIAAAMRGSGTVFLPTGTYGISANLQLLGRDRAVSIIGEGPEASTIKALSARAGVSWGQKPSGPGRKGVTVWGRPGLSHGWRFDGNLIATQGITVGWLGYGTWHDIQSTRVNGDGWLVFPQNSVFTNCLGTNCAGNGWTLDYGIQACQFIGCHAFSNDGWGFQVRQSGGHGWGGSAQPQGLHFLSGIVEQGGSPAFGGDPRGGFHIREGIFITFDRFEFAPTEGGAALVLTPSTEHGLVGRVVLRDCRVQDVHIDANRDGVAQSMGGTNEPLYLTGWNFFMGKVINGSTGPVFLDGPGDVPYVPEGSGAPPTVSRVQ